MNASSLQLQLGLDDLLGDLHHARRSGDLGRLALLMYIEDQLRNHAVHTRIRGRRDGTLSLTGELSPREMRSALGLGQPVGKTPLPVPAPVRPPRFCDGCGHVDAYAALKEALVRVGAPEARVFGDIGCYAMGAAAPMEAMHTCVEMGASLGMALGAAFAGLSPAVAVPGDSTFVHSGLPGPTSLARARVDVTVLVLDNRTVAERKDNLFRGSLALRYKVKEWLQMDTGYIYNRRDSNFSDFDYTSNVVFFRIIGSL